MKYLKIILTISFALFMSLNIGTHCFASNRTVTDELNEQLIKAKLDPNARVVFFAHLLLSDIYFLTNDRIKSGSHVTEADTDISLVMLKNSAGELICPIFTSVDQIIKPEFQEYTYVKLNARILLDRIKEVNVVLNPGSTYSLLLSSNEIQLILNNFKHEVHTINRRKVILGEPKEYSAKQLDTIISLIKKFNEISEAYIATITLPDENLPPHLLIAVRGKTDLTKIMPLLTDSFCSLIVNDGEIIDVLDISTSPLAKYFDNVKPFYQV